MRWRWLERLVIDVRYAVRVWARSPGFSAVALMIIAVGIGATTAIFAQLNAVFWTPLPVARPAELRLLAWTSPRHPFVLGPNVLPGPRGTGETFGSFSYPAYVAMRDGARAFSDLACWADLGEARPVVVGERGFASVQFVSGNYFRALGVQAAIGRTIQPDDDYPGAAARVAMLGHGFWRRAFGADPSVTRQSVRLNGQPFSIVGVMPEGFFGMDPSVSPDVVIPVGTVQIAAATSNPLQNPGIWNLCRVVGRIAPGVTDEAARADLEAWLRDAIAAAPPDRPYDPPRVSLFDGSRGLATLRDAASAPLLVLFAVVGGLLLAACANIAGLLLTRGRARGREIATRLALGAPASRIVRQLVTESLVLSAAGGVLGLGVAYALSGAGPGLLAQFMPTLFGADRTVTVSAQPDLVVFAFGAGIAMVAGLLFGVVPALSATRLDLVAMLKESSSDARKSGFGLRAGHTMLAAQTALALLLLVGAGLFLRTVANLRDVDLGFETERLLYARVEPRAGGLPPEQRQRYFEEAVQRLQRIPGAASAAATAAPVLGGSVTVGVEAEWMVVCTADLLSRGMAPQPSAFNAVTPRFFETMGIRLVAGRDFTWADSAREQPPPVIVNQAFARAYFGNQDPIGQGLGIGPDCQSRPLRLRAIGVVADTRTSLREGIQPAVYAPIVGVGSPLTLVVRASGGAASMIPTVRRAIRELNADIPTFGEATLSDLRERHLRRERLLADILLVFAAATLLVCCLGIYGMLSYSVARRRSEIGIRMAIGARGSDVVRMVVRESLGPVGAGIVTGCAVALALARWVQSLLYGISARDPWTIAAAAAVFLMIAAIAAAIPAGSAARVNPVVALRQK